MKRILFLLSAAALFGLGACQDLERELNSDITRQQLIRSYDNTQLRVNALYTDIPAGYLQIDGAMSASATDEAEHTLETSGVQRLNNGSWNAIDNPDNQWGDLYRGIRKVNQLLVAADSIDLDQFRLDPSAQATYRQRLSDIKRWKYEARFLRAYFYFELVKRYGGVPLFRQALSLNQDFSSVRRAPLEECFTFISNECDSAALNLPVVYPVAAADLGRATRGAALALKSRALLYAASDLFSTTAWAGGYSNPELISLTGSRPARWAAAAAAAKAVIDLSGSGYLLATNYRNLFINNSYTSPEIIFARRNSSSNDFEKANYPIGYDLGASGTTPSQNLVDAYELTNGTRFDWNNPAQAADPYANRDPRLGLNVVLNNTAYKGRPLEAWAGGRDGAGLANATKTGYYLKKYVNENLNLLLNNTSVKSWNLFRLAEINLNYAEALNESAPGSADIKLFVDRVRARPGVAMPALPAGLSQADMRERIRNERRVELAFEDHRGWDVRRWLIGPQTLGAPLMGVSITRQGSGTPATFQYRRIEVERRVFEPKMYLYPIPQNDINASSGLVQNPGW